MGMLMPRAQLAGDTPAVQHRHAHVQEDDAGRGGGDLRQRLGAVGRLFHVAAFKVQDLGHRGAEVGVVVDDEHVSGHKFARRWMVGMYSNRRVAHGAVRSVAEFTDGEICRMAYFQQSRGDITVSKDGPARTR